MYSKFGHMVKVGFMVFYFSAFWIHLKVPARFSVDSVEEICLQVLVDASVPSQVKREDASPSLQRRPNLRQCLFVQGGVTEVHMKEVLVILDESS